jgi:hypothetical protein
MCQNSVVGEVYMGSGKDLGFSSVYVQYVQTTVRTHYFDDEKIPAIYFHTPREE